MKIENFEWLMKEAFYPVEPDNAGEGAQMVDGQWYMPKWGCDTLQHIKDNIQLAVSCEYCHRPLIMGVCEAGCGRKADKEASPFLEEGVAYLVNNIDCDTISLVRR